MTVGERIKEVRTKLNMSQVAFADKINVSKQTLYKYENNLITNIPSDKIEAVAELGNVSPAYLMGWKINPIVDLFAGKPSVASIIDTKCETFDERDILLSYRELTDNGKEKVLSYCNRLVEVEKAEFELNAAHQRTDIEVPEGTDTSDNDIMDDENF